MIDPIAGETPSQARLTIRKYPNRRYYDTTRSRHVTLEEIYALIREGHDVVVTDSKSGEDITGKVLAQIIIELDPLKLGVFPSALLHRLLRANQTAVGDFVNQYINRPFALFLESQKGFEQFLQRMMGIRTSAPTLADWTRMVLGAGGAAGVGGVAVPGAKPTESPPVAGGEAAEQPVKEQAELRREVEELKASLAALRRRVGKGGAKKKGRGRSP